MKTVADENVPMGEMAYIAVKQPDQDFLTLTCVMDACGMVFVLHAGWTFDGVEVDLDEPTTAMLKEHVVCKHEVPDILAEAERIARDAV